MGIFKERRTSLPAMNIKVAEVEAVKEVARLDTEFVNRMATPAGVDILTQMEAGGRCLARLEPCPEDTSLYCLRLASDIPAFTLKTSCTHRLLIRSSLKNMKMFSYLGASAIGIIFREL